MSDNVKKLPSNFTRDKSLIKKPSTLSSNEEKKAELIFEERLLLQDVNEVYIKKTRDIPARCISIEERSEAESFDCLCYLLIIQNLNITKFLCYSNYLIF